MCKRHTRKRDERETVEQGGYEGQTIRLDEYQGRPYKHSRSLHWHAFPWWTLWLIWPLFGLARLLISAVLGIVAPIAATLPALTPELSLWPIVLIVAGILLLRRK